LTVSKKQTVPSGEAFLAGFYRQHPGVRSVIGLFEHLPSVLFYAKDVQHRYVAVNRRTLTDVFGLESVDDLLGRTDVDFQPPALAEAYHAEDRRVMESAKAIPNQVWLVPHVRGTPCWYVSSKTPLFAVDDSVIGIAGVMYPIATPEEQASLFLELSPVIRFVEDNYTETVSMKDMAAMAGLSATQFNVRFRSTLRMSPSDYVLSRRIQDAQKRLVESSESIAEIGINVGFVDQSHFTKRFRKITGMTPLAYRKRFRQIG
jgi:AraC-like DNA-binding protein